MKGAGLGARLRRGRTIEGKPQTSVADQNDLRSFVASLRSRVPPKAAPNRAPSDTAIKSSWSFMELHGEQALPDVIASSQNL